MSIAIRRSESVERMTTKMPKTKIEIWIEQNDFFRIRDLARMTGCTHSTMSRNLLHEALNQRECSAAIRQADKTEIDMRFCSPHCRHLDIHGQCHCSAVVDSVCAVINGVGTGMIALYIAGDSFLRHEKCPYTLKDFQWWQRGADEDAARGGE